MQYESYALVMENISKYYSSSTTQANDNAFLRVNKGEIHALVGENGAGKSTLMRILYGMEKADTGAIFIEGQPVQIRNPSIAARYGIGMVHQHFMVVDEFTVAENIALGNEPRKAGIFFDAKKAIAGARNTLNKYNFTLDPLRLVSSMNMGERQQLEIAKLLHRDARFLILDEPSTVLAEQEIKTLFTTLRALRDAGHTILIITHKIREVKELSDSVTVMRAGKTVGEFRTRDIDAWRLSSMIMGASTNLDFKKTPSRSRLRGEKPVFTMEHVSLPSQVRGIKALNNISLRVFPGEIVGICGVQGNGVSDLEDVLGGFRKPSSGCSILNDTPLPHHRMPARSGHGIGYVPADRIRRGAGTLLSVTENFIALDRAKFFPRGMLNALAAETATRAAIARFSIQASPEQTMGELSGGNIQKLILSRELSEPAPPLLVFSEPTWGLDIGSTHFVYKNILAARDAGSGIILLSSNLDEILELADRIAVLYRGKIVCDLPNDGTINRECLGEYMLGVSGQDVQAQSACKDSTKNISLESIHV